MAGASDLNSLQKIDSLLERVRRRLLQLRKLLGESSAVEQARSRAAATEAEMHSWHARQRNAEMEAQSLEQRIGDTDQRLMSGAVRNPKELEALQNSLEGLRRQRVKVEDEGVEAMLMVEELTARLAQEKAALSEAEEEWASSQGELGREDAKLRRSYVTLSKQRESLTTALDSSLLEQYEYLRKRKGGVAVAELQGDICGACHVTVPTGVASAARSAGSELVFCPSCGRVLYSN